MARLPLSFVRPGPLKTKVEPAGTADNPKITMLALVAVVRNLARLAVLFVQVLEVKVSVPTSPRIVPPWSMVSAPITMVAPLELKVARLKKVDGLRASISDRKS